MIIQVAIASSRGKAKWGSMTIPKLIILAAFLEEERQNTIRYLAISSNYSEKTP
jgi:hypothetical protein